MNVSYRGMRWTVASEAEIQLLVAVLRRAA